MTNNSNDFVKLCSSSQCELLHERIILCKLFMVYRVQYGYNFRLNPRGIGGEGNMMRAKQVVYGISKDSECQVSCIIQD